MLKAPQVNATAAVLHSRFAPCASWTATSSAKFFGTPFLGLSFLLLFFSFRSLSA